MEAGKKSGGGRLKLKGIAISKSSKERRERSKKLHEETTVECQQVVVEEVPGSGRIVSCGVTVHGFETQFRQELKVGDVIILFHPKQLKDEERIVVAVLSQRSLTLHESFSGDIASTTAYRIRKDSSILQANAESVLKSEQKENATCLKDEMSRQLEKRLKKAKPLLTYREKSGMWGYKVVSEKVEKAMTAEELLDLRVKKQGRDKFCW